MSRLKNIRLPPVVKFVVQPDQLRPLKPQFTNPPICSHQQYSTAMSRQQELLIVTAPELESPEDIDEIYKWVDSVPLSRVKKNINRDFADGVLMAEMVRHYFPTAVEMHNYPSVRFFFLKCYLL